ncbi:MFS transporter [Kitasatospora kifunensis]|uniref:MFS family permease n=1 Tax=Kitasatospora kifunensis TaxID=58351 RepID=A0A7W7QWV9_KITKI|nr:MFS transporter [Kitasatospora kifunensis]MBB4921215.1 MFS family permease [Kitasatospora kifunensis]
MSLWRNRDFVLLWSGQILSVLGTKVSSIAVPLIVLATTHSVSKAGLAGFVATLPYLLFYLVAGSIVDRYDRKRVMLLCEATRIVALGSIPVAFWLGRLSYPQLLIAGFVGGTAYVFFSVAEKSVLPALVSEAQLTAALAQDEAKTGGAALAGPPLGGVLFGLSHALPFLADAVSYLVSFVTIFLLRTDLRVQREQPAEALHRDIADGLRWVWSEPFVRITVLLVSLVNIMFQALTLTMIVRAKELGAASGTIGLMLSFVGIGGLAGAASAPWLQRRLSPMTVAIGGSWVWVLVLAPIALVPTAWALGPFAAAMAFVGPVWNVVVVGYQYKVIPNELLGRVKSVVLLVSWGSIPFGSLFAGYLLEFAGARGAILALAGLATVTAVIASTAPGIRRSAVLRGE